jgi:fructose-1,6-bisphosphatase/inositol monophosphatase family enzyme
MDIFPSTLIIGPDAMHELYENVASLLRNTAEKAVLPYYQKLSADQIEEKQPTPNGLMDLVTIADKEAEAMLSEGLARLLPGAAIVGEEAAAADPSVIERLKDDVCWIIDPVDGTNNFGAGRPPFGIMVALAQAGEAIAGWIYDPLSGRLCHAHKNGGAWIDGQRIQSRETGNAKPIAAISLIFMEQSRRETMQSRLDGRFELADIPRCAAEQYPRLVLGVNDISLFERTLAWDHAAGALFVNEAGGKVARLDGRPYRVDSDERGLIGAASPRLWDEAAALLAD